MHITRELSKESKIWVPLTDVEPVDGMSTFEFVFLAIRGARVIGLSTSKKYAPDKMESSYKECTYVNYMVENDMD